MDFRLPPLGENVEGGTVSKMLVKPGDAVKARQEVLQVDTEKASMGVQLPQPGTIGEVRVKVGDKVTVGQVVLTFEPAAGSAAPAPKPPPAPATVPPTNSAPAAPAAPTKQEFKLPDLGEGIDEATVTQILVKPGDQLKAKAPLFKAETSKANIPSPPNLRGSSRRPRGLLVGHGESIAKCPRV